MKHYQDYTVRELLDMGLKVDVRNYRLSKDEAQELINQFGGIETSSNDLPSGTTLLRGRRGDFGIVCFLHEEDE